MDVLAIRYDNNLFIPYDVFGDGNCFYSSLVQSDFIHWSESKIFRSDLTIRTNSLLYISESPEEYQLRNYVANKEFNSRGTINDYINIIMGVDGK